MVVGTKSLASGSASLTLTDLSRATTRCARPSFATESTQFTTSQSTLVTSTVVATSSTTTLTAAGGVQKVDLTAGVTVAAGTAAGTVQFKEGAATIGSATVTGGSATLALTGVTAASTPTPPSSCRATAPATTGRRRRTARSR